MSSLLAIVLPLAVGAAISPSITVIVVALLAGKDHPKARATAFLDRSRRRHAGVGGDHLVSHVVAHQAP